MDEPASAPVSYRSVTWANLVSLAIVLGFGVRPLLVGLQARGRVAALLAVPPWPLYAVALLLAAAAIAVGVAARLRRVPPERHVYRLLPVLSVIFLGVHVLVVPPCFLPMPADTLAAGQLAVVEADALAASDGRFQTDPAIIAAALSPYPAPFVDRTGERLAHWRVVVRTGCTGPVSDVPEGLEPGTVICCLSADRRRAWLTPYGTGDAVTGGPSIVQVGDGPAIVALSLAAAADASIP